MMQRSRYPANWEAISKRIRIERAKGKCEWCGAPHQQFIKRRRNNPAIWSLARDTFGGDAEWFRAIRVVLTVHHIGIDKPDRTPGDPHDKMDCRDENLAALCNRCHLIADLESHVKNARKTRARKKREALQAAGQLSFWDDPDECEESLANVDK